MSLSQPTTYHAVSVPEWKKGYQLGRKAARSHLPSGLSNLTAQDRQRLREAVNKAAFIYSYWWPSLRYKVVDFANEPLQKVQKATKWLLDDQPTL